MHIMKLAAIGLLGLSLAASASAWAQEAVEAASPADRNAEIRRLIGELSSPDEAVRTAAMQKLITMGDDARAALEEHIRSRNAALEALEKIEVNRVAGPSLVTVDVKDADVLDVLEQLSKQTGFRIEPYHPGAMDNQNLPLVTLSAKDAPFWQVMRELMSKGEIGVQESGNQDGILRVMPQRNMGRSLASAPCSLSGAFMVVATNIQRTNAVDLSNPGNFNRNMYVQFQVFAEPKVKILRYSYQPDIDEAVDDKGNSLVNAQNSNSYSTGRTTSWSMNAPLTYPDNPGTKIARLKGKLRLSVQTRSETLEVDDIMKVKDHTEKVAGHRVTVVSVTRAGENQCRVKLVVHRDGMDQQAFFQLMNDRAAIRLLDKDGRAWRYTGGGSSSGGDRYEAEMHFHNNYGGSGGAPGEPVKLVWEMPTASQEITVPFEFADLPLP